MEKILQPVEVTLEELLYYGQDTFRNLLQAKLGLDQDSNNRCIIHQYSMIGCPRPNVAHFNVEYIINAQQRVVADPYAEQYCRYCDKAFYVEDGIYHHMDENGDIDYDADDDHIAEANPYIAAAQNDPWPAQQIVFDPAKIKMPANIRYEYAPKPKPAVGRIVKEGVPRDYF